MDRFSTESDESPWYGAESDLGRWASKSWPLSTEAVLVGTQSSGIEGRNPAPSLGMWRSLGADHLTLVLRDAATLERYRSCLWLPNRILAPHALLEEIRRALLPFKAAHQWRPE
jgi:hypothetical protein